MFQNDRFNGDEWFRKIVDQRTREALHRQEQEFLARHRNDSQEQLAAYVRARARELGHSPRAKEVTGSGFIIGRFGSWDKALAAARLRAPRGSPKLSRTDRYLAEYEHQAELFKAERRKLKEEKRARKEYWLRQKELEKAQAREEQPSPERQPDTDPETED